MSDVDAVLKRLKDENIPFVDLRFTDPRGKWQHLAMASHMIEEETFSDGVMFDGSSIAGWKDISESDMALVPDPASAVIDPFAAQNSLIMFCDVMEPSTGETYGRDPRSTAGRAEQYLKYTGTGDEAFFGPEAEFFV
ncbi:MAG: glutamine synthetase beta-grasp domain-containing protein, partial [Alphaproteobacteria bacterium]|nr:glutamine synthetase beta-grasp domain-containing protein [Alphaproteobacteria bacterium]